MVLLLQSSVVYAAAFLKLAAFILSATFNVPFFIRTRTYRQLPLTHSDISF